MSNISNVVIFDALRSGDSTTVSQKGVTLARSVTGQAGYKHSQFAQAKTVDVIVKTEKVPSSNAADTLKNKHTFFVVVNKVETKISGSRKLGFEQIIKAVYGVRPDLLAAVLYKYGALIKSTGVHAKVLHSAGRGMRKSKE